MQAAFRRIVTHIAAAPGCEGEAVIDKGYPVTLNDARATALMKDIAGDLGRDAGWHAMPAPMMGAEDFPYVLRTVPGAMSVIGVEAPGTHPRTKHVRESCREREWKPVITP